MSGENGFLSEHEMQTYVQRHEEMAADKNEDVTEEQKRSSTPQEKQKSQTIKDKIKKTELAQKFNENVKAGRIGRKIEALLSMKELTEAMVKILKSENSQDRDAVMQIVTIEEQIAHFGNLSKWGLPRIESTIEELEEFAEVKERVLKGAISQLKNLLEREANNRVSRPGGIAIEVDNTMKRMQKDDINNVLNTLMIINRIKQQHGGRLTTKQQEHITAQLQKVEAVYFALKKKEEAQNAAKAKEESVKKSELSKIKEKYPEVTQALEGGSLSPSQIMDITKGVSAFGESSLLQQLEVAETKVKTEGVDYIDRFYRSKGYIDHEEFIRKLTDDSTWTEYGWSPDQKNDVVAKLTNNALGFSGDHAELIRQGLLLHGMKGDTADSMLQEILDLTTDPYTNTKINDAFQRRITLRRALTGLGMIDYLIEEDKKKEMEELLFPTVEERSRRAAEQKSDYESEPQNLEEFAWQVAHEQQKDFGPNGDNPVFKRMVRVPQANSTDKRLQLRQIVRADNLTMWLRERVTFLDGQKSTQPIDFGNEVQLSKTYASLTLNRIFEKSARIFTDQDGNSFAFLEQQWQLESIIYSILRQLWLEFQKNCGKAEKLQESMQGPYFYNILTRPIYQRSLLYWVNTLSENYTGKKADSKMGAVINTLFMAYTNICNEPELKKALRKNDLNELFNLHKLRIKQKAIYDDDIKTSTGEENPDSTHLLDLSDNGRVGREKIKDIFDLQTGDIKAGKMGDFLSFINFFNSATKSDHLIKLVRKVITDRAVEIHNMDKGKKVKINSKIADMMGYSMAWFMGGSAMGDNKSQGFNWEVRNTKDYREKQFDGRGGFAGNPHTVGQFKRWLIPMMHAVRSSNRGKDGNPKTVYQLFEELMNKKKEIDDRLAPYIGTDKEDEQRKILMQEYQNEAAKFSFEGNAMRDYMLNHWDRTQTLFSLIYDASELKFEKYTSYVPEVGVVFNREDYQKDFKRLVTQARYAFSTFDGLNYNMPIWEWDKKIGKYRYMPLGEAMFGYELLDIPEFWATDAKTGQVMKHVIDYGKVNGDKKTLFKQWVLTYIAGQIIEHRSLARWATGTRHGFAFYEDIYDMLEKMPGNILSDEADMRGTNITTSFFNKEQIEWLRRVTGTKKWWIYSTELLKGLLFAKRGSKERALNEIASIFTKFMLQQL